MADYEPWPVLESRTLFDSRFYRLRQDRVRLPDGSETDYSVIDHPGWVIVVGLTPEGEVVMVRVHRHTVGATLLECPAGGLDGESPLEAGQRELEEETGYTGGDWHPLGAFYTSTGISNERFHLMLATGVRPGGTICREATEHMELSLVQLDLALGMAMAGRIEDAPSALSLILAANARGQSGAG